MTLSLVGKWVSDDHRLFVAYYGVDGAASHAIVEDNPVSDDGLRAKVISVDSSGYRVEALVALHASGRWWPLVDRPLELETVDLAARWARRYGAGWSALGFGQGLP